MFNFTHLHLMTNHLPIVGSFIVLFMFTHALITKKEDIIKYCYIFYAAIGVLSVFIYLTGDPSAEAVKVLPGIKESIIEEHENFAFISLLFFILTGALSLFALYLLKKRNNVSPVWIKYTLVILSFISVLSVAYTAKSGGEIRHTEITNTL